MTVFIGIDPGLGGALCVLDSDGTVVIHDMPTYSLKRNDKTKREVDPHRLSTLLSLAAPIRHVFIEQVGAMPGQGVSGVFSLGKSFGIIIGVLAAHAVPMTFVAPAKWKRALGVPAAKDGARARASQLLPQAADQWGRVKDDGRAEAALIALYGLQSMGISHSAAA